MGLLVLALLSSATHGLGEYAIAHLHRPTASSASTVGPDLVERLPTETDCGGPWMYASVCRDAHVLQQPFMCQVCRSWAALDRVVSAHNRNATKLSRLSGGISLHQAQLQAVQTIQIMQPIIKRNGAATVCETGFNAGHSTLLFLALPNTTVVTFDTFQKKYQRAALHYIRHDLGLSSRLHVGIGDTLHTVRSFAEAHRHMRCDLAHPSVPGREHSDLLALQAMSRIPRAFVIMSKFMPADMASQSADRTPILHRPARSWEDALRDGLVWNPRCAARTVGHMFCWAQFASAPPLHSALVMAEMGNRVLARSITHSAVVLIGRPQPQQMIGRLAAAEGHDVIAIRNSRSLQERLGRISKDWVLLLFVDAGGKEAPMLSATLQALRHATVTYIVMRFQPLAVKQLFEKGYKVMMLSCTHLLPDFLPNVLITRGNVAKLAALLLSGEGHAYIFATQGLDLAIPSRQAWKQRRCEPASDLCRRNASHLFARSADTAHRLEQNTGSSTAWFSHEDPQLAEAACETLRCAQSQSPQISCSTRVLVPPSMQASAVKLDHTIAQRPNLLLLLIDPISRGEFSRSMPRLSRRLPALGYDTFTRYAAVGNNSGPNQAALYRGRALRSRQDLGNSTWLWDKLGHKGYATFKGEDSCVLNSNMIQSIRPRTTHGQQLEHLFCQDAEQPGCLGRMSASSVLLEYTTQFINEYSKAGIPWAAFAHFVDTHDDSPKSFDQALDRPIEDFLTSIDSKIKEDTIIVVTSDHGLHYGPFFNTEAGRRERAEPVLHMRLAGLSKRRGHQLEAENRDKRITAFDLHDTLAELLGTTHGTSKYGQSLLHPLPLERSCATSGIPQSICADTSPIKVGDFPVCVPLPAVPSQFSFYQDMLPGRKPRINCSSVPDVNAPRSQLVSRSGGAVVQMSRQHAVELNCRCASQRVPWRPCISNANLIGKEEGLVDVMHLENDDAFALVKCGANEKLARGFDVHHRSLLVPPPAMRTAKGGASRMGGDSPPPDVLVIEIDSLSRAAAHRHLPKLMQLLDTHPRILGRYIDVELKLLGVAGSNSVPNQAAFLSGCEAVFQGREHLDGRPQTMLAQSGGGHRLWCPFTTNASSPPARPPWLFSIAKQLGYTTFFGEEICSAGSPWAIDALIKDSGASHSIDHSLDAIYCRIAEQTHRASWPADVPAPQIPPPGGTASPSGPLFQAEFGTCIGGQNRFAWPLKQIEQLWQAHGDSPKFAFYSSSPLHAWLQQPMVSNSEIDIPTHKRAALEAYDATLSDFLDPFLHRHPNTLILLRGDHGQHHGPEDVEFDVQVEHRMPWGRLLVPSRLVPNASRLRTNAERLLSPFDLHATLQAAMLRGTIGQRTQPVETLNITGSRAPIDLLMTEVPALRTCRQARIPAFLCPCQHERLPSGDFSYGPWGVRL